MSCSLRGHGVLVEPGEEEFVADGESNCAEKKPEKAKRHEAADSAEENNDDGSGDTAPQKNRLQNIVRKPDDDAPDQEDHRFRDAGNCEHIDHSGDEHDNAFLQNVGDQKNPRPQAGAGESLKQKAEAGEDRLDERHADNTRRYAANGSAHELLQFRASFAEDTIGEGTGDVV